MSKRLPQYARRRTHPVVARTSPDRGSFVAVEGYERITSVQLAADTGFKDGDRVIVEFTGMKVVKFAGELDRACATFRLIDPFTGRVELVG